MGDELTVYDAVNQMRELSRAEKPVSFSFMSYSQAKQRSQGIVEVRRALMKRRTRLATYEHAPAIEEYIDLDTMEHRKFYIPTLMTMNGKKTTLK